jgi:hypothetical protein
MAWAYHASKAASESSAWRPGRGNRPLETSRREQAQSSDPQILFTCLVVPAVGGSMMGCGEGGSHPAEAASIGAGTGEEPAEAAAKKQEAEDKKRESASEAEAKKIREALQKRREALLKTGEAEQAEGAHKGNRRGGPKKASQRRSGAVHPARTKGSSRAQEGASQEANEPVAKEEVKPGTHGSGVPSATLTVGGTASASTSPAGGPAPRAGPTGPPTKPPRPPRKPHKERRHKERRHKERRHK